MSERLEAALTAIDANCPDPLVKAKLRGLMYGYDNRWGGAEMDITGVEQTVTSDVFNPITGKRSRTFRMAGKLDIHLRENGLDWIMDHKTTSEDIADPNASYWRQLTVEGQHHHYGLLEFCNGRRIEGAVWDVVKKPGISPKQIAKADLVAMNQSGFYFGFPVSLEDSRSANEDGRETPTLYEHRLAHDCTELRADWYFQRRRIARLDAATAEYADELWGHGQDILTARNGKPNPRWPRNSGACLAYGRACTYLGICSGYDTPDSSNWQKRDWLHPELPILDKERGRNILTNSRIKCFQLCRKLHYYKYELGIERVESEDIEALYFGSQFHSALEAYFTTPEEQTA